MDVFGIRSKEGIWWDETRRSLSGVRGAFEAAILHRTLKMAKDGRIKVLRQCKRTNINNVLKCISRAAALRHRSPKTKNGTYEYTFTARVCL